MLPKGHIKSGCVIILGVLLAINTDPISAFAFKLTDPIVIPFNFIAKLSSI